MTYATQVAIATSSAIRKRQINFSTSTMKLYSPVFKERTVKNQHNLLYTMLPVQVTKVMTFSHVVVLEFSRSDDLFK